MICNGSTIYQYVVEEDDDKLTKVRMKDLVHSGLERGWCVAQPKWHYFEFVMAIMGAKDSFGNVSHVHTYLMLQKIKLREVGGPS